MANEKINNLILSGEWEIEPFYGLQYVAAYMHDLNILESGGSFSDLRYSERRKELAPRIISPAEAGSLSEPEQEQEYIAMGSIMHLRLSGAMRLEGGLSAPGVRSLVQDIQRADRADNISGILLEVNSAGGEVTAGTELQNALEDVRAAGNTPVVVYTQMLASAALRGTLPANFVMAAGKSAQIGSIGTFASVNSELLRYIRDNYTDYYAEQSSEKNLEYRELQRGNAAPLVKALSRSAGEFISEVMDAKKLRGTELQKASVVAGALFGATEALEIGLIDGIGTFSAALEKLRGIITENQNPGPVLRGLLNNKGTEMDFKNFVKNVITEARRLTGVEIKEDSTAEEVISALQEVKPVGEFISEAVQDLKVSLENVNNGVKDFSERLAAAEVKTSELENTVAELKAGFKEELPASGGNVPNRAQFQTITNFGSRVIE